MTRRSFSTKPSYLFTSRYFFGALAICAVAAGCSKGTGSDAAKLPETPPAAVAADVALADSGGTADANIQIFTGTVDAHRHSVISARVPGFVARVNVQEGDKVRKGDPIVELNPEDLKLNLRQAQAMADAAKAQMDTTKSELDRMKGLLEQNAVSQSQYDQLEAGYRGAKANFERADAGLAMLRKNIRDAVIRAPYNAIVSKLFVNEGETVMTMPPTPMVMLEETELVDVKIQLPENMLGRVQRGSKAKIRFSSLNLEIDTTVTRTIESLNPMTKTYAIVLEIPNKDGKLAPGMFAEVGLQLAPQDALTKEHQ